MILYDNTKDGAKELSQFIKKELEKGGINKYKIDEGINTIYLAGAPGSGKTEFINTVINTDHFIIIDIDRYREYFAGYNGKNSSKYQDSCSRVATSIYEFCIQKNLKLIFDGTLTSEMGIKNISKAVKKNRKIGIVYIFQDPVISYSFTKARQVNNQRNVPLNNFINIYYNSIEYTFKALERYKNIAFVVASKKKDQTYNQNTSIQNKKKFDLKYKINYNRRQLVELLNSLENSKVYQLIIKILGGLKKN